jgi:hypothetical protein
VAAVRETLPDVPALDEIVFCCYRPTDVGVYEALLAGARRG